MKEMIESIFNDLIFWMAWIVIPLLIEIIPAICGFFILIIKKMRVKKLEIPLRMPEITLIIPVYNSADTLHACLASVDESDYPNHLITIMLVNNCSTDNSFHVFQECQVHFPTLSMQWLNSQQGKSKALNLALYNSTGKYIIHIDSDGTLEKNALKNIIIQFEQDSNIHCVTGSILTNSEMIPKTKNGLLRFVQKLEFYEYCQAFLVGRNVESEFNKIYTISGAFSAFRKSTILKTQLYNSDTVCEDTHVTFQVRKILNKRVHICENAIFFVSPIEDLDKLYVQRQRWQRGEIEVANMFYRRDTNRKNNSSTKKLLLKTLLFDHTFAFPRLVWYFALLGLACLNYPIKLIISSTLIIYLLYVFSSFLYYLDVLVYLRDFKEVKRFYYKRLYLVIILPFYNFVMFWVRFAGIINCIKGQSTWKTKTLLEEKESFNKIIKSDFSFVTKIIKKFYKLINND